MTTGDAAIEKPFGEGPIHEGSPFAAAPRTWWDDVEARIEQFGEKLNPILVKEARQALKSRQFVMTFFLLLICGWGWSLVYLFSQYTFVGDGIFYAPHGSQMLSGFYFFLSFPMLVVVPFTAFRSLSAEREDGTFELVSITTLKPRQIIGGKLGSAILQMLLYMSALAPGMAFTYMLRGVDIVLILMICGYLFLASLSFSVLGLLLATVTSSRAWQMVLGVIFILGLALTFFIAATIACPGIWNVGGMPYDQMEFWAAQQCLITIYLAYTLLIFLAASARITFESDNRSTRLRVCMLGIHALCIGWCMWLWINQEQEESLYAILIWAGLQWAFWGGLMVGETAELSPRVRRSLPQSYLARLFFTWFNPGPGTGYMFTVVNVFALMVIVFVAAAISNAFSFGGRLDEEQVLAALFVFSYVVFYVGITRLLMMLLEKFAYPNIFLSVLVLILMMLIGTAVPTILSISISAALKQPWDYSALQFMNWFWTLGEIMFNGGLNAGIFGIPTEAILATLAAGGVLLLNVIFSAKEVDPDREATPTRVIEEERELHPERFEQPTGPSSPWDEDEPADATAQAEPEDDGPAE